MEMKLSSSLCDFVYLSSSLCSLVLDRNETPNEQQTTTNNQQPTTNNQQTTTNKQQPTTDIVGHQQLKTIGCVG
jgi:hypothetical protein